MVPGIEHKRFRSFDGTEIAYQARGAGPCVVLVNGLGGTYEAFRHVYAMLGEHYRTICWDYRGLARSSRPRDLRTLAIPYHCHDIALLLDHEGIDRAVFIGWSMGVQVGVELFREHRRRMAGLVAIDGACRGALRTALAARLSNVALSAFLAPLEPRPRLLRRLSRRTLGRGGTVAAMRRLGLVSDTVDAEALRAVEVDLRQVDPSVYGELMRHLARHDAGEVLDAIDIPVLLIAGDRDPFTPLAEVGWMNRSIAGSRLVVVKGGTHYTLLERPDLVRAEIGGFLEAVPGWEPRGSTGSATA